MGAAPVTTPAAPDAAPDAGAGDDAWSDGTLSEREERYRLAARGTDDGLWDWDLRRGEIRLCPRWTAIVGLRAADRARRPADWLDRIHPADQDSFRATLDAHLSGRSPALRHQHRLRHADGSYRWVLCRGRVVRAGGAATRIAGSLTDVTERVAAEATLHHAALHDPLTGAANRALFLPLVAEAIAQRRRQPGHGYAVLFVDVDRFKAINDTFGHRAGDALLVALAGRLQACLRAGDTLARVGGDEFAILLRGLAQQRPAEDVAERVLRATGAPFAVAGREIAVSVSIGLSVGDAAVDDPEAVLDDADRSMYRAKSAGGGRLAGGAATGLRPRARSA